MTMWRVLAVTVACLGVSACAVTHKETRGAGARPSEIASPETARGRAWSGAARVDVTVEQRGKLQRWVIDVDRDNDVLIHLGDADAPRQLLLVNGKLLLLRGLELPARNELDVLDTPLLHKQLLLELLQRAVPEGVGVGARAVALDESERSINVGTPNTTGYYATPWKLKGRIEPAGADTVTVDWVFTYPSAEGSGGTERMAIKGSVFVPAQRESFAAETSIDGWYAYSLRPGSRVVMGIAVASFVAVPDSARFRTLGELRARLKR